MSEIEVLGPEHTVWRHIPAVLPEKPGYHPIGQDDGRLPSVALKRWIEVGKLWLQPRFPTFELVHTALPALILGREKMRSLIELVSGSAHVGVVTLEVL